MLRRKSLIVAALMSCALPSSSMARLANEQQQAAYAREGATGGAANVTREKRGAG
ncbi:MAG: hypothetical protein WKF84_04590 [Pyrinomonadaceae bacterium]